MRRRPRPVAPVSLPRGALWLAAVLAGCTGEIAGQGGPSSDPAGGPQDTPRTPGGMTGAADRPGSAPPVSVPVAPVTPVTPGSSVPMAAGCTGTTATELRRPEARVRRLNRTELRRSLEAVVGAAWTTPELPADLDATGVSKDVGVVVVRDEFLASYWPITEAAADRILANAKLAPGCAATDAACARTFATKLAAAAWRRDATAEELEGLVGTFRKGAMIDAATGLRFLIQRVLLAPAFLYLQEDGAFERDGRGGPYRLAPHRIAEQLAYFLWSAPPDEALLAAAKGGGLATAAGVRAEAQRMLRDGRARAAMDDFFSSWLHLTNVRAVGKDPKVFPELTDDLRGDMAEDSRRTLGALVFDKGGTAGALLSHEVSFPTPRLARFLKKTVAGIGTDTSPVAVDLPGRSGILTHPAFLTVAAKEDQNSTVIRGHLAVELLFCAKVPDPPPGTDLAAADPSFAPGLTLRERMERHAKDPACSGCHNLFEPLGYALEGFDAVGRPRTMDAGKPVDTRVTLRDFHGVSGEFDGIAALAPRLATAPAIEACFVSRIARHALGRTLVEQPAACTGGAASKRTMMDLVLDLVSSPAFLERVPPTATTGGM